MAELNLIVLNVNSKDGAAQALEMVKELDRDGWIELVDYALARKDEKGHCTVREMDDEVTEKAAAATVGASGGMIGAVLGGPAGAVSGVAVGALAGAGSIRLMERLVKTTPLGVDPQELGPDSSLLAVVVVDRYAERVDKGLQKLGRTAQRELKRAERDAEFEAYLERSKAKIRSIENAIQADLAKARTATAADESKIQANAAAHRAYLEATREKLEDRIKAMNIDLKSEIREMNFRLELAGLTARSGIVAGIHHLHRQLNHNLDELGDLIEHQIETLKTEISDLKTRAAKASGETKAAIEHHLKTIESRLHREQAKLHDSFEERMLQIKQWFENLHVQANLLQADVRDKVEATINAAEDSFAELKARVRMRNREDERSWKDIREGFNEAAKDLEAAFDKASHERV